MVEHLFGVPAGAYPQYDPAVADPIQARDRLGEGDGIVLGDEADGGAELEGLCRRGDGGERDKGIVRLLVVVGSSPPPPKGDLRLVGMWVCSAKKSDS